MPPNASFTPGFACSCCSGSLSGANTTLVSGKTRMPDRTHRENGSNVECFRYELHNIVVAASDVSEVKSCETVVEGESFDATIPVGNGEFIVVLEPL